jgi:thioredoxin-like negative regulator of GroEL
MNGLLFLSSDDFYIDQQPSGALLNSKLDQGLFLVLFYSTQCQYCARILPIFKQLPSAIHGCAFGIMNVSNHIRTIYDSRKTIAPIDYVPYIVLYLNGMPCYKYKGPADIYEIQQFIFKMSSHLQTKQEFVPQSLRTGAGRPPNHQETVQQPANKQKETMKTIPEYTIGIPYCEDGVCYLDFDEAYLLQSENRQ